MSELPPFLPPDLLSRAYRRGFYRGVEVASGPPEGRLFASSLVRNFLAGSAILGDSPEADLAREAMASRYRAGLIAGWYAYWAAMSLYWTEAWWFNGCLYCIDSDAHVAPGDERHVARLECKPCGRFIRWLPNQTGKGGCGSGGRDKTSTIAPDGTGTPTTTRPEPEVTRPARIAAPPRAWPVGSA